jgi:hypothetical protein
MLSQPDRLDAARRATRTATAQANDLPAELAARLMRLMAA